MGVDACVVLWVHDNGILPIEMLENVAKKLRQAPKWTHKHLTMHTQTINLGTPIQQVWAPGVSLGAHGDQVQAPTMTKSRRLEQSIGGGFLHSRCTHKQQINLCICFWYAQNDVIWLISFKWLQKY